MNKAWLSLIFLVGCVKPQQSALQSGGIDLWSEMESYMVAKSKQMVGGSIRIEGEGELALATIHGEEMDLQHLVSELLIQSKLPHLYDLCEPMGVVSVHMDGIRVSQALPMILEQAGYRCAPKNSGSETVWVIADGGPSNSPATNSAKTYKQYTPHRITASSLRDNLLQGSSSVPALWPQGNSTGLAVGLSPESNRLFLTGPTEDVHRTLQILQKADQSTQHVLLDCILIYLKESIAQSLYAKLDLSGGPLFLTGLGNTLTTPPFGTSIVADSGMINANVLGTTDQPFSIQNANAGGAPALKALLQNIENRQIVRAQLLVQSGQQASLQIGRNGYLLLTTYSLDQPSVTSQQITAGSTLQLTPKALPNGKIRVDANLQVARFEDSTTVNLKANTLTFQTINTVQVRDGEPVLLSGGVICFGTHLAQGYPGARQIPILNYLGNALGNVVQDFHLLFILRPTLVSPSLASPGLQKSIVIPLFDAAPGIDNTGTLEGG
jgi:hypothetical protein